MASRLTRTYLAVPAHRERLVRSAAASQADAVFLDLEDAVPAGEKGLALARAAEAIAELDWGAKWVAVRLNAIDSPTLGEEIVRLGSIARLDSVILPKAERPADVVALARRFATAASGRAAPMEMELLIETALGLVNVEALAGSAPTLSALHLGVGDLAASLGARSVEIGLSPPGYRHVGPAAEGYPVTPLDFFAYPMMRLLVAARAFGLRAIDGPCGDFRDATATQGSAAKAAAMGFDGKQVIHPSQIAPTRHAFVPGEAEVVAAQRVMAAFYEAEAEGKGAVTVDGRMVDAANLRMIERVLRLAEI